MSRLRLPILSAIAFVIALPLSAATQRVSSPVVARVDRETISLAELDATLSDEVRDARVRLQDVARRAAQDVIDDRIALDTSARTIESRRAELYRAHGVVLMLPLADQLESELPANRVIARIGGEPIRAAALEQAGALRLYRLRGELYMQRRRQLDTLIEQRLL
jgi:hypothetical protein